MMEGLACVSVTQHALAQSATLVNDSRCMVAAKWSERAAALVDDSSSRWHSGTTTADKHNTSVHPHHNMSQHIRQCGANSLA